MKIEQDYCTKHLLFMSLLVLLVSVISMGFCLSLQKYTIISSYGEIESVSVFNVKDFGAKGDGVTNDTEAIQRAIDAARTVGGIVYFPSGTYMVDRLTRVSNLTLKGYLNATLKLNPQSKKPIDQQFGIIYMTTTKYPVTDVTIEGLIFDGNKFNQDPTPIDTGLRSKAHYALLRIWKDPNTVFPAERITIRNCIFRDGSYYRITNNVIRDCKIGVEASNKAFIYYVWILNNTFMNVSNPLVNEHVIRNLVYDGNNQ